MPSVSAELERNQTMAWEKTQQRYKGRKEFLMAFHDPGVRERFLSCLGRFQRLLPSAEWSKRAFTCSVDLHNHYLSHEPMSN
jgi:hypothetical protein